MSSGHTVVLDLETKTAQAVVGEKPLRAATPMVVILPERAADNGAMVVRGAAIHHARSTHLLPADLKCSFGESMAASISSNAKCVPSAMDGQGASSVRGSGAAVPPIEEESVDVEGTGSVIGSGAAPASDSDDSGM